MKKFCIFVFTIIIVQSCTDNHNQTGPTTDIKEKTTDSFFPVTTFIKGQITILDSLPVTPLKITTIKGKTDSVWLPKEDLKLLLLPFLVPVINETNLTKYFTETSFNDQTINAITFTYDPSDIIPDSISFRHWDVYVDPETGIVTKVYIVKKVIENNQVFTQQLTWQTNKLAKITTILNKPDGNMELLKEVVIIWNFGPIH